MNDLVVTRVCMAFCWLAFVLFFVLSSLDYTWDKFIMPLLCEPVASVLFSSFGDLGLAATFPFLLVALPILVVALVTSATITSTALNKIVSDHHFTTRCTQYIIKYNLAVWALVLPCCIYLMVRFVYVLRNWQERGPKESMNHFSNVSGYVAIIAMALFMVPVVRINTICEAMQLSPIDASRIHVYLGTLAIITTLYHGAVYLVEWIVLQDELGSFWGQIIPSRHCFFVYDSQQQDCEHVLRNFTGLVAAVAMIVLGLASMGWIRRASYRLFYMTHVLMTPLVLFATVLHWNQAFLYLVPGLILWMSTTLPQRLHGNESVEVEKIDIIRSERPIYCITMKAFPRVVQAFRGGQYLQLRAPTISQLGHPFSVVGVPLPSEGNSVEHLRVIFRAVGPFTVALGRYLTSHPDPVVQVEIPYGTPLLAKILAYKQVKIVAGGVGITAFISAIREFAVENVAGTEVEVHWFCRDRHFLSYILKEFTFEKLLVGCQQLRIVLYHTANLSEECDDSEEHLEMESAGVDLSSYAITFNERGQNVLPVKASPLASGIYMTDNLCRFCLLLVNTVMCLSVSYIIYGHHQPRKNVWSRIWGLLAVLVLGSLNALIFVSCIRRYPSFSQWRWELVPRSSEMDFDSVTSEHASSQGIEDEAHHGADAASRPTSTSSPPPRHTRLEHCFGRVPLQDALNLPVQNGREETKRDSGTAIFVCGPKGLCNEARRVAEGLPFYKEEFEM